MDITATNDFAAPPATTFAMLTSKEFLERCCAAADAIRYDVEVAGDTTKVTRVLPAPPQARKFTGEELTISQAIRWEPAAVDGSRRAEMELSVPGLPVSMHGTARLAAGGKGSTVAYAGDLKVNIPFLGKKLEADAAPAILEALKIEQREGDRWLAEH